MIVEKVESEKYKKALKEIKSLHDKSEGCIPMCEVCCEIQEITKEALEFKKTLNLIEQFQIKEADSVNQLRLAKSIISQREVENKRFGDALRNLQTYNLEGDLKYIVENALKGKK